MTEHAHVREVGLRDGLQSIAQILTQSQHKYLQTYLTLRGHINQYARDARDGRAAQDTNAAITINLSLVTPEPVSYTHLTLPTIYSV